MENMVSLHSRPPHPALREVDVNLVNEMMAHEGAVALLDEEIEGLMRNVRHVQIQEITASREDEILKGW